MSVLHGGLLLIKMLIPPEMAAPYFLLKVISGEPATLDSTKLFNKRKFSRKLG